MAPSPKWVPWQVFALLVTSYGAVYIVMMSSFSSEQSGIVQEGETGSEAGNEATALRGNANLNLTLADTLAGERKLKPLPKRIPQPGRKGYRMVKLVNITVPNVRGPYSRAVIDEFVDKLLHRNDSITGGRQEIGVVNGTLYVSPEPLGEYTAVRYAKVLDEPGDEVWLPPWRTKLKSVSQFPPHLINATEVDLSTKPSARQVSIARSVPRVHLRQVSCARLTDPNNVEAKWQAVSVQQQYELKPVTTSTILKWTSNCAMYKAMRGYITDPVSEEEAQFPLAYTVLFYKDVEQFERLLRAIYRPQNYYCLHLDKRATKMAPATQAIADCFDNVFLPEDRVPVYYMHKSILEAEMVCLRHLAKRPNWKYFINLTGQEFPLKTNWELVQILKAMNGSSLGIAAGGTTKRWRRRLPAPTIHGVNVTLIKGSPHTALPRAMVQFMVNDEDAQKFYDWVMTTSIPEETYFASLISSPQVGAPGAYMGNPRHLFKLVRHKIWQGMDAVCDGKFLSHAVCILGVGDINRLTYNPKMFANKFRTDQEPFTYDCMEEWFFNRTRQDILGYHDLNVTYFKQYDFTWNHL